MLPPGRALREAALLAALAGAGCVALEPVPSYDDFAERLADVVRCERAARCGRIGESEVVACRAAVTGRSVRALLPAHAAASLAAGRAGFDGANAARCLEDVRALPCLDVEALPASEPCRQVLAGRLGPTQECAGDLDCREGYCTSAGTGCGPGTCEPFVVIGEPCEFSRVCGPTGYCHDRRVCAARHGTGGRCITDDECAPGLTCIDAPVSDVHPGSCARPALRGEPCGPTRRPPGSSNCVAGLRCDLDLRQCLPLRQPGESCDAHGDCVPGYACAAPAAGPSRCTPWLDTGAACPPAGSATACPADTRCDGATARCVERDFATAGRTCDATNPCRDHFADLLHCSSATRACAERPELGDPCHPMDAACVEGTCDSARAVCVPHCPG